MNPPEGFNSMINGKPFVFKTKNIGIWINRQKWYNCSKLKTTFTATLKTNFNFFIIYSQQLNMLIQG